MIAKTDWSQPRAMSTNICQLRTALYALGIDYHRPAAPMTQICNYSARIVKWPSRARRIARSVRHD